jgi:hypothetical protein
MALDRCGGRALSRRRAQDRARRSGRRKMKTIALIAVALVVTSTAAASSSSGVIFSKRAARYETHRLLASSKIISARCKLPTRRKLVCRFRFVHNGSTFTGDAILVPLTLHSYRQTTCVSRQCETERHRTADKSGMIIRKGSA